MDKRNDNANLPVLDFGQLKDMSKNIIKVIGVGGGGCNAVKNMYLEGIADVSFAVCNTDTKALSTSPVSVKILLGHTGLRAGGNPDVGRDEAQKNVEDIKICSTTARRWYSSRPAWEGARARELLRWSPA